MCKPSPNRSTTGRSNCKQTNLYLRTKRSIVASRHRHYIFVKTRSGDVFGPPGTQNKLRGQRPVVPPSCKILLKDEPPTFHIGREVCVHAPCLKIKCILASSRETCVHRNGFKQRRRRRRVSTWQRTPSLNNDRCLQLKNLESEAHA